MRPGPTTASPSAAEVASGFSISTCRPAARQRTAARRGCVRRGDDQRVESAMMSTHRPRSVAPRRRARRAPGALGRGVDEGSQLGVRGAEHAGRWARDVIARHRRYPIRSRWLMVGLVRLTVDLGTAKTLRSPPVGGRAETPGWSASRARPEPAKARSSVRPGGTPSARQRCG